MSQHKKDFIHFRSNPAIRYDKCYTIGTDNHHIEGESKKLLYFRLCGRKYRIEWTDFTSDEQCEAMFQYLKHKYSKAITKTDLEAYMPIKTF